MTKMAAQHQTMKGVTRHGEKRPDGCENSILKRMYFASVCALCHVNVEEKRSNGNGGAAICLVTMTISYSMWLSSVAEEILAMA